MTLKDGDKVKVEYTGSLSDGTVFDSSEKQGQPLEFEIGSGQIIPGFENNIKELEEGSEKEFVIKPEEGYGEPNDEMIKTVPRDQLPQDKEITEGMAVAMETQDGQQIPGKVTEASDEEVTIDFNHPLAGQELHFKVKLVGVNS